MQYYIDFKDYPNHKVIQPSDCVDYIRMVFHDKNGNDIPCYTPDNAIIILNRPTGKNGINTSIVRKDSLIEYWKESAKKISVETFKAVIVQNSITKLNDASFEYLIKTLEGDL